ncbi:hypothetical protein BH20CHL6_BH20CHL6_12990 [soil metagenome]
MSGILIDLEGVLLESRFGERRDELQLRPGVVEGLSRLRQVTEQLVVLVEPLAREQDRRRAREDRVEFLRAALGREADDLLIAACPHPPGSDAEHLCRKPDIGLIQAALEQHGVDVHDSWYIGGDQEGVQSGRQAGLHTIRIGPPMEDHRTAVHRPDYEARDLLDAANWILVASVSVG